MKFFGMCLNWKVVAGLAVAAVGVWVLAPGLIGAALPLLIVLACPLSCLFMMRGMGTMGTMGGTSSTSAAESMENMEGTGVVAGDHCGMGGMGTIGTMSDKRTIPEQNVPNLPRAVPLTQEERLADLQARVASIQAEQDAIAREIAALEDAGTSELSELSELPVVRQAEAAARAAAERLPSAPAVGEA